MVRAWWRRDNENVRSEYSFWQRAICDERGICNAVIRTGITKKIIKPHSSNRRVLSIAYFIAWIGIPHTWIGISCVKPWTRSLERWTSIKVCFKRIISKLWLSNALKWKSLQQRNLNPKPLLATRVWFVPLPIKIAEAESNWFASMLNVAKSWYDSSP